MAPSSWELWYGNLGVHVLGIAARQVDEEQHDEVPDDPQSQSWLNHLVGTIAHPLKRVMEMVRREVPEWVYRAYQIIMGEDASHQLRIAKLAVLRANTSHTTPLVRFLEIHPMPPITSAMVKKAEINDHFSNRQYGTILLDNSITKMMLRAARLAFPPSSTRSVKANVGAALTASMVSQGNFKDLATTKSCKGS